MIIQYDTEREVFIYKGKELKDKKMFEFIENYTIQDINGEQITVKGIKFDTKDTDVHRQLQFHITGGIHVPESWVYISGWFWETENGHRVNFKCFHLAHELGGTFGEENVIIQGEDFQYVEITFESFCKELTSKLGAHNVIEALLY